MQTVADLWWLWLLMMTGFMGYARIGGDDFHDVAAGQVNCLYNHPNLG